MHEKTLKWTEKFPLALIGQIYLETNKIFLWHTCMTVHNIYSGILYKVISIFGHDFNVLLLSCFPAAHSSEENKRILLRFH